MEKDARTDASNRRYLFGVDGLRSFADEFGIHLVLEISIVSLLDQILMNAALSLLVGIIVVEGCQFIWNGLSNTRIREGKMDRLNKVQLEEENKSNLDERHQNHSYSSHIRSFVGLFSKMISSIRRYFISCLLGKRQRGWI